MDYLIAIKRFIFYFTSSNISPDELDSRSYRQVRLINIISFWLITGAIPNAVLAYYIVYPVFIILMLGLLNTAIILLFLRKTHRINLAAHLLVSNLCLVIFTGNLFTLNHSLPFLIWMALIPVVTAVILSDKLKRYASIAIMLLIVNIGARQWMIFPNVSLDPVFLMSIGYFSLSLLILVITTCLMSYIQEKTYYEDFLLDSRKFIEQEKNKYFYLAHRDELTNLDNRIKFNQTIETFINLPTKGSQLAIVFIDLDRMKFINDNYGHQAGDSALRITAQRIKSCFRENDVIARIGGDEFGCVVIDPKAFTLAEIMAERVLDSMSKPFSLNGSNLPVTCSIGISVLSNAGGTIQDLLEKADTALYEVKRAGGNDYAVYKNPS